MRDHVRICGSPGGAIPGATRPRSMRLSGHAESGTRLLDRPFCCKIALAHLATTFRVGLFGFLLS